MAIKNLLHGFILSLPLVACLVPSPAFSMPGYPSDVLNPFSAEPEPFRREDEIEGRTFEYNDESFLHRFSYRIPLDWQLLWDQEREGFIITAGSTRSDELFVSNLLRKTITLNEKFFGIIRFERSEDFDSRFDRFLTGVGAHIANGWSLALVGNVIAEKEDISPQFELTWENDTGDRFRAAFVMTDYLYNSKTDDDSEYAKYPYTIFTEGKWAASKRVMLSGWMNYNTDLAFELADSSRFSYEQFMMEASALFRANEDIDLLLSVGTQTSDRSLTFRQPAQNQQLDRDNVVLTVETQCALSPSLKSAYGIHYFFLDESGTYQNTLPEGGENLRREYMPFAGLRWRNHDFGVSPTIYLDFIDLDYPPGSTESDAEKLIGKLALPLHYYFSPRAMATFDVTMELHEADFGGFDVQFVVLF